MPAIAAAGMLNKNCLLSFYADHQSPQKCSCIVKYQLFIPFASKFPRIYQLTYIQFTESAIGLVLLGVKNTALESNVYDVISLNDYERYCFLIEVKPYVLFTEIC